MNKKQNLIKIASIIIVVLVISGCSNKKIYLEHIHGLGYTNDGKQIVIPAHSGLINYTNDKWGDIDAPNNDYMGFTTVDNGFYSSGHPAAGSELKNPIGIVKSLDMGKSIIKLDFEGTNDFHNMAVGFKSHAIYVFNEQPNEKLKAKGLYVSKDDGQSWNRSGMNGFNEEPLTMAVHPSDDKVIAIGTKRGLYLSTDSGNHFDRSFPELYISGLCFSRSGDLLVSAVKSPVMFELNLSTKEKKEFKLPSLDTDDAVSYIASNPSDQNEVAIATFKKDIYISKNLGLNWKKIADKGNAVSQK